MCWSLSSRSLGERQQYTLDRSKRGIMAGKYKFYHIIIILLLSCIVGCFNMPPCVMCEYITSDAITYPLFIYSNQPHQLFCRYLLLSHQVKSTLLAFVIWWLPNIRYSIEMNVSVRRHTKIQKQFNSKRIKTINQVKWTKRKQNLSFLSHLTRFILGICSGRNTL